MSTSPLTASAYCGGQGIEREGPAIDSETQQLTRQIAILRFFAIVFAVAGMVIFIILYLRNVGGALFSALRDPSIVLMVLFPFLPAVVLSHLAARLERKRNRRGGNRE